MSSWIADAGNNTRVIWVQLHRGTAATLYAQVILLRPRREYAPAPALKVGVEIVDDAVAVSQAPKRKFNRLSEMQTRR